MHILFNIFKLFLWVLVLSSCQPSKDKSRLTSSDTYFPISIDGHELQLQIALSANEQQKGLMSRDHLASDHGMLFLFERPGQRSFWMRNTRIPLDIGYFDASGQLMEVYPLFPFDETPVTSRNNNILIAVETNYKWFDRKGIKTGAVLDLSALTYALKCRNYSNSALIP